MARTQGNPDDPITIKKYANRRLYNTGTSSYITLDDLARMTREDVQFKVVDAKTGDDITHSILTQIIMEEESSGGEQMLPVSFLRDLISMYGNSMQAMMPGYLEASMANFRKNQTKLQEAFRDGMGSSPFAKIAETNMAMMRAATEAFMPGAAEAEETPAPPRQESEIAALREQMAAMQKKLDELGK
ncbi:polyhydroxyalkanoate synthesis repressor PhaR [Pelagerythrobacter marensis]|uniref:Polyhydroxyalkanoate synthesis repressor PhaR n=1 Tax=Pelagerythrobacter marensis TaxID=543877 RepID=A0A0G3X9C5_9SPHN|nr:polyhydroxyalkanoate synthesis repressor PhaR [Pelagerythrobacter marensis]AKM06993.1 polyhydroxyalkanoate synthesis repressor PhaR [Pelagerythrobacter marensis]